MRGLGDFPLPLFFIKRYLSFVLSLGARVWNSIMEICDFGMKLAQTKQ